MQRNRPPAMEGDLSTRVLDALAQEMGCSPIEFDTPMYDVIDPDALNALFAGGARSGHVEFSYLGYRVTIHESGDIDVTKS